MADDLDAHVRRYSESANTDASCTLASSVATPIPSLKPSPLIGTKVITNTILKSHGRPPWYFPGQLWMLYKT
jgi:uridine kinase